MIIKNSNLRRALYYNRYKILGVIVVIILLFGIIQIMNQYAKQQLQKSETQNNTITNEINNNKQETPVIIGKEVSPENQQINHTIINQFISHCNNQKIEEAYNLLTEECKEQIFSNNIQNFQKDYVDLIFKTKKTYTLKNWISKQYDTYKIRIIEDILQTGDASSIQNAIEDYYTIIYKNNEYRLNIKGYIKREDINQQIQKNDIKITVLSKDVYTDYEKYNFKIENDTNNTVCIDTKKNGNTMYLLGENDRKYNSYYYELEDARLLINKGNIKTLSIKYNKIYSNQIRMTKIIFEDIILNYEEYKNIGNKEQYQNKLKIEIEI